MKIVSFVVAGCIALAGAVSAAHAKTYTVGEPAVAVISLPDRWKPREYDGGVEANAPDGGVYVAVEPVKIADIDTAMRDSIRYFQKHGVKLDQSTLQKNDTTIAGMPAVDVMWEARDKEGPTNVGLTFVVLNEHQSVLLYIWGTDDDLKEGGPELKKIGESLKPVGR